MPWLTSTVRVSLNVRGARLVCIGFLLCLGELCLGQELDVPASVTAGEETTIPTTGSGKAVFYLLGPGVSSKSEVSLGQDVQLHSRDLRNAGDYLAIVCSEVCRSTAFYVRAGKPAYLNFLVHPSRVPVAQDGAVSGVVLPFDEFHNLVLDVARVNFRLAAGSSSVGSPRAQMQDGVAWFRTTSGRSAGKLQVVATLDSLSSTRIVQQVASDPCNLRIKGERTPKSVVVETEPVHDCSGNPVPDGTIVTFSATGAGGKSTVDAPMRHGIASAKIQAPGSLVISAASGTVMGNELHVGGQP
jgi:hypothetical protein